MRWRGTLLRVCGSAAMLAVLLLLLPFDQLKEALLGVRPIAWAAALPIYLVLHLLGVAKWRLLTNLAGAGLSFLQAARFYYAGLFGNVLLPSIVGGDVVRAGMALRHVRSKSGLLLGSVLDRVLDFTALAAVAGFGLLLLPVALDARGRGIFWIAIAVVGFLVLTVAFAVRGIMVPRMPFRIRRKLVGLRRASVKVAERPGTILMALGCGVTLQSTMVLLNIWLGRMCGLEAAWAIWFFVWPLAKLSAALPITQGGIGVREAAQALLFAPFGVPAVLAVAVGLVFQAIIIVGGIAGGLIALLLGSRSSAPPLRSRDVLRLPEEAALPRV